MIDVLKRFIYVFDIGISNYREAPSAILIKTYCFLLGFQVLYILSNKNMSYYLITLVNLPESFNKARFSHVTLERL